MRACFRLQLVWLAKPVYFPEGSKYEDPTFSHVIVVTFPCSYVLSCRPHKDALLLYQL